MSDLLDIDGSLLEGGGQILRIAMSLSALLGKPIRVTNIRSGRSKPGLAEQHLKGIMLVAEMCQGKLKGANIGSTEIEFRPGQIRGGHYVADVHTAGSISLLLQVALPCALFADKPVSIFLRGGTNVGMAPQIDYMTEVFKPALKRFNADFNLDIRRRGFFPKGNGQVAVDVTPVNKLNSVNITERGSLNSVYGWSFVSGTLPIKLAYAMSDGAKEQLRPLCNKVQIECYKEDRDVAPDNCNCIILASELSSGCILGSDGLGRRGVDPYEVGKMAGEDLRKALESGACVDDHTQDQLILYMALAEGKSVIRTGEITLHTQTAMHIVELISQIKFNVTRDGDQNLIECEGMGFLNKLHNFTSRAL